MLLAAFSLLHQIIAITYYSTMVINKIAEMSYLPTGGVADHTDMYHQLHWKK
jgi:hypothetical protein